MLSKGTDCLKRDFMSSDCLTSITGWAIGADKFVFPKHVGYPIERSTLLKLEMHYDNQDLIEGDYK